MPVSEPRPGPPPVTVSAILGNVTAYGLACRDALAAELANNFTSAAAHRRRADTLMDEVSRQLWRLEARWKQG